MKKRNILKRNSGFIAVSVIAAGASFFAADTVLTELRPGSIMAESENNEPDIIIETEKESTKETTYETNPFTISANGTVINQVESEVLRQTEKAKDGDISQNGTSPETDADGNVIGNTAEDGAGAEGETLISGTIAGDGGQEEGSGSDGGETSDNGSYGESSPNGGSPGGYDGGGSSDGGYSGEGSSNGGSSGGSYDGYSDGYYTDNGSWQGEAIEILDPGGGSYSENGGGSGDGSGGDSYNGGNSYNGGSSGGDSSGGSYENGIYSPDDLILWHINSRYIGEEELYNYDAATIRLIRNEIFALHGRMFDSPDLQEYFGRKSWYVPTYEPAVFDEDIGVFLNDYELANLKVILAYEDALNGY